MSNQTTSLLRTIFSNLIGLPFGNIDIFPGNNATTPSLEHKTLNRLFVAVLWFFICIWLTDYLVGWDHMNMAAPARLNEMFQEDANAAGQEDEDDGNQGTEEERTIPRIQRLVRQQIQHDLLEREAYAAYQTPLLIFWREIAIVFTILIIFSQHVSSFDTFASTYSFPPTWKNFFVFMFGEFSWSHIWTIPCGIVAWSFLHLGVVMSVRHERQFHLLLDVMVREAVEWIAVCFEEGVEDVIEAVEDGVEWVRSVMRRGGGGERESGEGERDWSAWEVEEEERRRLGLPVRAPRVVWGVRI